MRVNRRTLFVALLAIAVLATGVFTAAHFSRRGDAAPRLAVLPAAGLLISVPGSADILAAGDVGVAAAPVSIRYTFDGGVSRPITDVHGGYQLTPVGQNGGALSLIPQGAGLAVQYPARCTSVPESDCPRAILEGVRDDNLNPGTRPLRYGASILMTHADLADGANIVQKGYSVGGGSQFKVQVDHEKGHPSCVIAGRNKIYRAEPQLDVADGTWHDLACTREAAALKLTVDGVEQASVPIPPGLSIANPAPLRIGGKGANRGNDQYAGQIDNVFLSID
ncbi:hypothetical protein Ahu01nite_031220 [Winogradskya humida]|uniref:Concanavalin A-like lectin/glucanase superfamily protein n=1 Tax=Winogradskya humida TaxID=113566 RepID=A0ABQ3ZN61_9ACTN|nr:hypothetical protein Ahu01nite_031220 [Actinoplanes humidus]